MRQSFFTVAILSVSLGAAQMWAQTWVAQASGTKASLRGVSAVDPSVAWASGSGGTYLRTVDGGAVWHAAVVPGAADLDFRAVHALDGNTAWLMSSGPGDKSRIYKTADAGAHWSLLFSNPDAGGFFDGLAFWDVSSGVVLGDPVGGQFVILTTEDGGHAWKRHETPPALPNEGAFAASNSSLIARGKREIWFATGGATAARVFHSQDGGQTWDVAAAPLVHGVAAAGIFSLGFADQLHGVAAGGDYSKPGDAQGNVALTSDGGRTWLEPSGTHPHGYRSAVVYLDQRKVWIAVGTSGSDMSSDGGRSWKQFDTGTYSAIGATGKDAVWAVGSAGRVGRLRLE
jgi:photosystem II stability/assembly factor-like uncharacterized protein